MARLLLEEEEEKEVEEAKGDTILINERESGARARRKEGRKEERKEGSEGAPPMRVAKGSRLPFRPPRARASQWP